MERERWVEPTYMVFSNLFYDSYIGESRAKLVWIPRQCSDWSRLKKEKVFFSEHFES